MTDGEEDQATCTSQRLRKPLENVLFAHIAAGPKAEVQLRSTATGGFPVWVEALTVVTVVLLIQALSSRIG